MERCLIAINKITLKNDIKKLQEELKHYKKVSEKYFKEILRLNKIEKYLNVNESNL
mgnify:CR=1 FL=1|tara:strand:+ start:738 stop:905 length:168 start_codon:yes stop_codon:yes gene_type:complete